MDEQRDAEKLPRPLPSRESPHSKEVAVLAGELLVAVGVIGLGAFFVAGALAIRVTPSYAHIGPRFFPLVVGAGLLACGALLLVQALRGVQGQPEESDDADAGATTDWRAVGLIAAALVLDMLLFRPAGFVLASTVLFTATAAAFRSRNHVRDTLVGFVLAVAFYLVFTRLLGLHLPAGLLPG